MLPAPGQGALAVTVRSDDRESARAARQAVHHEEAALEVTAERAFLRRLEGGCQVPVAAYARRSDPGTTMRIHGRVISLSGNAVAEGYESASVVDEEAAADLGTRLAERLLREGADRILSEVRMAAVPLVGEP